MSSNNTKKLGEVLVERSMIQRSQLDRALQVQLISGGHLGTCLVELGYMREEALGRVLAEIQGLELAPPGVFENIPQAILDTVPVEEARRRTVVPFSREGNTLKLAVIRPRSAAQLSAVTGCKIIPYLAPEIRILRALEKYYGVQPRRRYLRIPAGSTPPLRLPAPGPDGGRVERGSRPDPEGSTAFSELARRMSEVQTHGELGELILGFIAKWTERCILFDVKEACAGVANWKGVDLDPDRVRGVSVPLTPDSILALAAEESHYCGELPSHIDSSAFYRGLGIEPPREILILPIYGDERLEAVLYGDGGRSGRITGPRDGYPQLLDEIGLALRMLSYRTQPSPG